MNDETTIYEQLGGDPMFRRLVDAFYKGVAGDPLLRPMYPEDLAASKEHLFLFLTQYFGSPPRYNGLRGHPRLRMRHTPFVIDQAARDAWMTHMRAAVDAAGIPEPAASVMRDYFERAATFLINHNDPPGRIDLLG
jgi:hemoglobin